MQQVPIYRLKSSNPAHGEVCSIQYYLINFVIDLRVFGGYDPLIMDHRSSEAKLKTTQLVFAAFQLSTQH
jgi:hypothetical protein